MALLLWTWFLFSVEREDNVSCCEVRHVGGSGKPWAPAAWGPKACCRAGQLVRGHEAHPPQLGWVCTLGQVRGRGWSVLLF